MAVLLLVSALPAPAFELAVGGAAGYSVPVASIKQLRFRSTLHQQFDFSCGSAALATLLTHHYGYPVSEQVVFERMFARGDQNKIRKEGFSMLDMRNYLSSLGLLADGFQVPLDKLAEAGLPAIVLVSDKGYQHFVVIKGVMDGRVLIGDPASGTRSMSLTQFERIWRSKLLFVIHGQARAAFNASADWRAAPVAPLGAGLARDSAAALTLPWHGPGDF
ncbi:MAG: C39 family peptidase [Gammaproteobacteria bacterium]